MNQEAHSHKWAVLRQNTYCLKKNQSSSIRAGAFLRRLRQACASAKTGVFRSSVTLSRFPLAVSQGLNRDSLKTLRHSRFAGFAVVPYQSSGRFALLHTPCHQVKNHFSCIYL